MSRFLAWIRRLGAPAPTPHSEVRMVPVRTSAASEPLLLPLNVEQPARGQSPSGEYRNTARGARETLSSLTEDFDVEELASLREKALAMRKRSASSSSSQRKKLRALRDGATLSEISGGFRSLPRRQASE